MVVTTTLLCSKFSSKSVEAVDTLKRNNLESSVKILWIDHPNVRQAVLNSNQIKSVPAMVVHDEERDFTMVYEKDQFTEYMTALIQNRTHSSRSMALQQSHNQVLQQQQAMSQQFQLAKTDLNNHVLHNLNPIAIQEKTNHAKEMISKQMFGPSGFQPIDEQKYNQQIQSQVNQMRSDIYSTVDQQKQLHQMDYQVRMQHLKKTQEEERLATQQLYDSQQRQSKDREEKASYEAKQIRKMGMLPYLRQNSLNAGLSDHQLLELAEDELLDQELNTVSSQLEQTRLLSKVRQDQPHMTLNDNTSREITLLESKRSMLMNQKNNLAASLRTIRSMQHHTKNTIQQNELAMSTQLSEEIARNRKQLLDLNELTYRKDLPDAERQSIQQQIVNKSSLIESLEKNQLTHASRYEQNKFKLSGNLSKLNNPTSSSDSEAGTTSLASLGIVPPSSLPTSASGVTNIDDLLNRDQIDQPEEVVTTESVAGRLQREKFSNQVDLYKTQEKFNNPEGVTRLDTTDEMSLFDIQQQLRRPSGTDLRQTESQIETAMNTSKRNQTNHKIREIYNREPVVVPRSMMGVGHENLPNSSLARVAIQSIEENTPIDDEIDFSPKGSSGLNSTQFGAFSNTVNIKNDQIDGFGDERAAPSTSIKKSKVSDLVKEMERERNTMS